MEQRKLKRRHLIYYLRVFDRATHELIGHLADVTVEGFMLVSETPIPTGREFQLRIEVPEETEASGKTEFTAESRWCRPDINDRFFDTGFLLREPSLKVLSIIGLLVAESSFRD